GGLDVASNKDYLKDYCSALSEAGIKVSLFIDADQRQLDAAVSVGAPVVEIHTGHYADAMNSADRAEELKKIRSAVTHGLDIGLQVNAGHGLDYHNVQSIAEIEGIRELNIGHSIISRALFSGLEKAVADMKRLIQYG
ncbi:MAG: pyridoxine 5'-phosphate synthase, partial [Candidatus Sedimenticola sp. 6PFRAG1]